MKALRLTFLVIYLFVSTLGWAAETCSRVAIINYQEVLVDSSSSNRGEGLRFYLEKDETAKALLNEYQENNRPTWRSAAMSTVGTGMMLGSFMVSGEGGDSGFTNRNFLLFGGATLIAVSYLISKTNAYNNEYLLSKSIEEYNKRNTPKIYFSPTDPRQRIGAGIGIAQEF